MSVSSCTQGQGPCSLAGARQAVETQHFCLQSQYTCAALLHLYCLLLRFQHHTLAIPATMGPRPSIATSVSMPAPKRNLCDSPYWQRRLGNARPSGDKTLQYSKQSGRAFLASPGFPDHPAPSSTTLSGRDQGALQQVFTSHATAILSTSLHLRSACMLCGKANPLRNTSIFPSPLSHSLSPLFRPFLAS